MADRGNFGMNSGNSGMRNPYTPSIGSNDSHDFMRLSQVIGTNVQKINNSVAQMHSLLNNSEGDHDRLHQIQHYTNQLAKDTNKLVKDLSQIPPSPSPSEQKQQKIQRERLLNEFTKALNSFQMVQRQEKEKERANVVKAKATTSRPGYNDPFSDSKLSFDSTPENVGFRQPQQQQQQSIMQLDAQEIDMELVAEREEALRKLESDIVDVNQIFKDLGMLVHEQGEVIDSIEANVESAGVNVEEGTEQLRQAKDYQTKARKKKCIIITVLIVIVAIIVIVLVAVYAPKSGKS